MNWLNHIPLFRLLLPFSIGIMWAFYNPTPLNFIWVGAVSVLVCINIVIIKLKKAHRNFANRWVFGSFSTLLFFLLGFVIANSKVAIFSKSHFSKIPHHQITAYQAVVISEPEIKANSIKTVIEIQSVKVDSQWKKSTGKCLTYFKKSDSNLLKFGDKIQFLKTPTNIEPPANFDEFNYKRYLSHHYIYHRLYLANYDFQVTGLVPINWIKSKSISWRNQLLNQYIKAGIDGEELAIISALTLGKKESLSNQLKSAYSSAGAMHVLAVSGLHVGIIIMILHWLLHWMDRFTYGKIVKAIFLMITIWVYAFITGLSPSVVRAATMFTFMILATSFKRKSNIYNTLALSAFVILLFKPFMILEVGFQLSYLAVIGIIYLHPYLYNLVELKPGIVEKAWNITCVSLSAQLATAPLGILYFHQFPSYFLFSNLIVIPAAFAIVSMAIFFQMTSFIPLLGEIFALLLKWLVFLLNAIVKQIEELPQSLVMGLDVTVFETWLMYLFIFGITVWLTQYNPKSLLFALSSAVIFTVSQSIEKWQQLHQKEITIYEMGKSSSIEFTNGTKATFLTDSSTYYNADKMQFYVYHHWWKRGLTNRDIQLFSPSVDTQALLKNKAMVFGNTRILKIENDCIYSKMQIQAFQPHFLYINTYKTMDLSYLSSLPIIPTIILGDGTSQKVKSQVKNWTKQNTGALIDLKNDGAVKVILSENFLPQTIYTPKTSLKE